MEGTVVETFKNSPDKVSSKENVVENNINNDTDEISLLDLLVVLWRWKWLVIGLTGLISVSVIIYTFVGKRLPPDKSFMPDVYTSIAFMRIQEEKSNSSLSTLLSQSSLGGLAGLSGTGSGNTLQALALYLAGSNSFLDAIADEFNVQEKYKITKFPKTESRKIVKSLIKAKMDDKNGIFSLEATHIDPVFAQKVVLFAVRYYEQRFSELGLDTKKQEKENLERSLVQSLNEIKHLEQKASDLEHRIAQSGGRKGIALEMEQLKREITVQEKVYGQLKAQYELLKIEIASEAPLFQILDMPEVPEKKSGPSRGKICIIACAASLFFSIFLAFLLNALQEIQHDPAFRMKFKRGKNKDV